MAQRSGKKTKFDSSKKRGHRPQLPVKSSTLPGPRLDGLATSALQRLGTDFSQATFGRHADLLGDPRMSHPMYALQRAAIMRQLQQEYGNRYVQRLVKHIKQPRAAATSDSVLDSPLVHVAEQENHAGEVNEVGPDIVDRIESQQGSGRPLDGAIRAEMEPALGQDFGNVRVHTGPEADALNREVQAEAFTTGSDMFFREGNYVPDTQEGKELLAHELTHVVQQQGAPASSGNGQVHVSSPDDASEVEAANVAESVVHPDRVARQAEEEEELAMARQAEEDEELAMARVAHNEGLAVQRDPVAIAGLGLAVFQYGQAMVTSGNFSCSMTSVNYIHENTPPETEWTSVNTEFSITASHPRYFVGTQEFWFRLSYEHNGNDVRNIQVNALVNKSSEMITSSFSITFSGQAHSVPADPKAEVNFQIGGNWDPVGRGFDSIWGNLLISADGSAALDVGSEVGWVEVGEGP